jgi:hypothetical protein
VDLRGEGTKQNAVFIEVDNEYLIFDYNYKLSAFDTAGVRL